MISALVYFIAKAKELYADEAIFIDISKLLVEFIDQDGWEDFKAYYQDYKDTPSVIFNTKSEEPDLFKLIIEAIKNATSEGKIPMLIRTGALYGTGIENVNIMEHSYSGLAGILEAAPHMPPRRGCARRSRLPHKVSFRPGRFRVVLAA